MPKDAKLGLVVGVGLVVLITVVFFKKDPATAQPTANPITPAAVNSTEPPELKKSAPAPVPKSLSAEPPSPAASPVSAPLVPH